VLAFAFEVAKIVDVEKLIVDQWNLICLFRLIPQTPVSINNNSSQLRPTIVSS